MAGRVSYDTHRSFSLTHIIDAAEYTYERVPYLLNENIVSSYVQYKKFTLYLHLPYYINCDAVHTSERDLSITELYFKPLHQHNQHEQPKDGYHRADLPASW
jgi:hypothetical protein